MSILSMMLGRMSMHEIRVYPTQTAYEMTLREVLSRAAQLGLYAPPQPSLTLSKVLAELEIPVLDSDDVERYKKSQYRFRTKAAWWNWRVYDMATYKLPIPIHVIAKAIEIKEKLPSARFRIHAFEFDKAGYVRWADPFIEVLVPGLDLGYFFEVWDEPTFNGDFTVVQLSSDVPATLTD